MTEQLHAARELAEKIQFSGDSPGHKAIGEQAYDSLVGGHYSQDHLQISAVLTPALFEGLHVVCDKLALPADRVTAYVYPSAVIGVDCFASSAAACIFRFSSALIHLLDEREFQFVAGRALGHFLLGSERKSDEVSRESVALFTRQRAREISVDRLGLIACAEIDDAIRAMVKTMSGLSEPYLRLDVGAFVAQLEQARPLAESLAADTSHSFLPLRCRALLCFDALVRGAPDCPADQRSQLDEQIQSDLSRYVEGLVEQRVDQAKKNFAIWRLVYEVVEDGVFDKREQESVAEQYGQDTIEWIKNTIDNVPISELKDMIYGNIKTAQEELASLIPESVEQELQLVEDDMREIF